MRFISRVLLASVALAVFAAAAHAAPVITYTVSAPGTSGNTSAPDAAESLFLSTLGAGSTTENFDSFTAGTQQGTFSTSVGDFTMAVAGANGLCTGSYGTFGGCENGLVILDSNTTPFNGRFATSPDNWLDSFDAREVHFDPIAGVNSIGMFISDPNDAGGRFQFTLSSGDLVDGDLGRLLGNSAISNGRLYYVTFTSSHDITRLSIITHNSDDGFGIDDVTVARVPEPGTLALLGLGLLGAGAMRRRRT
jgi:hypothetical protein